MFRASVLMAAVAFVATAAAQSLIYSCPMHPSVRGRNGERCPICRMPLTASLQALDGRFSLDVDVAPRPLKAGARAHVSMRVRNARTGAMVRKYEVVHEKIFHLFVVDQTLDYFLHLHPALRPDGELSVEFEVPKPGTYQLIADFMPAGGAPQLIQRSFVTAGYSGRLGAVPQLAPDLTDKAVGDTTVRVVMPNPVAGREQLVTFELTDTASRQNVTDLEPYLGAPAHLLVVSADTSIAMHSHPIPELSTARGPSVVFQVLFPRAGEYRMWAQFQRHGQVIVAPFTTKVSERF